jgi:hypothetical protein
MIAGEEDLIIGDNMHNPNQVSVRIGEFTIYQKSHTNEPLSVYIWRDGKYGSEGGNFSIEKLNKVLADFWKENF